jgi:hypothetical protein
LHFLTFQIARDISNEQIDAVQASEYKILTVIELGASGIVLCDCAKMVIRFEDKTEETLAESGIYKVVLDTKAYVHIVYGRHIVEKI